MSEPDWVQELRRQCEATSQAVVAKALGMGTSTINQVLRGTYKASTDRIEQRVRGRYMAATVACPVLGEIRRDACMDHQRRKLAATNPLRVRLFQTCPNCAFQHQTGGSDA